MLTRFAAILSLVTLGPVGWAMAQSSSLFKAHQAGVAQRQAAATQPAANGSVRANAGTTVQPGAGRNEPLAAVSLTAVSAPQPSAIQVNDLIGVIIRHRFRSQIDARLQQENEFDVQSKLDAWFRIHDHRWVQQDFQRGKPEVNFRNDVELQNQSRSNRQDILETRMNGRVIDVKPNGNLVIVASYEIDNGQDVQQLVLSGEIHPRDLSLDRTITSDKIAELRIKTTPEGDVANSTRPGWLKRIYDKLKAF